MSIVVGASPLAEFGRDQTRMIFCTDPGQTSWKKLFEILTGSVWSSEDVIAKGRQAHADHCAACHGPDLESQPDWRTLLASGRVPAPPQPSVADTRATCPASQTY